MILVTIIDTFYNGLTLCHHDTINAVAGGTFMKRTPEECYDLIENMSAHHNFWDSSAERNGSCKSVTPANNDIVVLAKKLNDLSTAVLRIHQSNQNHHVKVVNPSCKTCGGPHPYTECPASAGFAHENMYVAQGSYNAGGNSYQPQGDRNLLSYHSNNYLGPPGFNQSQNQNAQNRNQNFYQNQNRMHQGFQTQGNFNSDTTRLFKIKTKEILTVIKVMVILIKVIISNRVIFNKETIFMVITIKIKGIFKTTMLKMFLTKIKSLF